jgi:hypothetical protein
LLIKIGETSIPLQFQDPLQLDKPQTILRAQFSVEKTSNRDPNKATVTIYNLSESNRKQLQTGADLLATPKTAWNWPLLIEAGYTGNRGQIFSGDVRFVSSRREGVDWVTTVEADDGGRDYSSARLNKAFGPGTTVASILNEAAKALGVGLGNSATKFAGASFRGKIWNFKKGVVLNGSVARILDKYVTSAGYSWSIQDGQLQVLGPDETLLDVEIVLNSSSGLIGTPEKGEKGIVRATSLIRPEIRPGRRIALASSAATGTYKALSTVHSGDTRGNDWYTEWEGKALL